MFAQMRVVRRLTVLATHISARPSSAFSSFKYPRLPQVSVNREQGEAEVILPGYSYGDLDRTGHVKLWRVASLLEGARSLAFEAKEWWAATQQVYWWANHHHPALRTLMLAAEYSFTPAFYDTHRHLYNPLMVRTQLAKAGRSSYQLYEEAHCMEVKDGEVVWNGEITSSDIKNTTTLSESTPSSSLDNTCRSSENTSKSSENTSRSSENTSRSSENTSKSSENTSKSSENTSRSLENTTRSLENTSKSSENTSRSSENTSRSSENTSTSSSSSENAPSTSPSPSLLHTSSISYVTADTATGRPVELPEQFRALYDTVPPRRGDVIKRVVYVDRAQDATMLPYTARHSHSDMQYHTNQAQYLRFALDAAASVCQGGGISRTGFAGGGFTGGGVTDKGVTWCQGGGSGGGGGGGGSGGWGGGDDDGSGINSNRADDEANESDRQHQAHTSSPQAPPSWRPWGDLADWHVERCTSLFLAESLPGETLHVFVWPDPSPTAAPRTLRVHMERDGDVVYQAMLQFYDREKAVEKDLDVKLDI